MNDDATAPEEPRCTCPDDWWASGEATHTPGCPCTPEDQRELPLAGWSDDTAAHTANVALPEGAAAQPEDDVAALHLTYRLPRGV